MRLKRFIVLLSFVVGIVFFTFWNRRNVITPEAALQLAKRDIKRHFRVVHGAWIYMNTLPYDNDGVTKDVYYGGVTIESDETSYQIGFYVDQQTGDIVHMFEISD
ncbi:hypothetical protein [Salirhabdus salicampi]|uniref:hypothetical protein n=1 Tax=Salirhabdus salicampi TaxID=476102 RepID=UPI0020C2B577|nr:hypothetical protein [Salirhabdus salicampi]MCP8617159.1 hypothetical protein [Salirhabdus salicampi]